jgi:hypothetical protein
VLALLPLSLPWNVSLLLLLVVIILPAYWHQQPTG